MLSSKHRRKKGRLFGDVPHQKVQAAERQALLVVDERTHEPFGQHPNGQLVSKTEAVKPDAPIIEVFPCIPCIARALGLGSARGIRGKTIGQGNDSSYLAEAVCHGNCKERGRRVPWLAVDISVKGRMVRRKG